MIGLVMLLLLLSPWEEFLSERDRIALGLLILVTVALYACR